MAVLVAVMIMADNHGAMMLALVAAMAHMMLSFTMAAGLLGLPRRHIAIAPTGFLSMLLVMNANFMAVMVMVNMNPAIMIMVPIPVVSLIVVVFGEQRSAQGNGKNQQKA